MNRPVLHNTNALGLYIPDQTFDENEAPFSRPREAEQWISELPRASVGETSRLVYKALAQLNRSSISAQNRLKILELLRAPVKYVTESLNKHYIGQPFPLTLKTRKIAELSQELQWEMANGYKIIIDASLSSFNHRIDGKMLLQSLGRATFYLGQCLLKSYQIYAPAPKRLWLEIHHLYLFAEHNDLHDTQFKDKQEHGNSLTNVLNEYKKTVLLALANPYRLPQAEIEKAYHCLQEWCEYSELYFFDKEQPTPGLFAINLAHDAPPSYALNMETDKPQLIRILDTSEVARLARNELIALDDDMNDNICPLSQETLRRLVLALGGMPKRSFSRINKNTATQISLGLNATHFFIEQAPLPKSADKFYPLDPEDMEQADMRVQYSDSQYMKPAKFSSHNSKNDSQPADLTPDIWDIASNPSLADGSGKPRKLSIKPFLSELEAEPDNKRSTQKTTGKKAPAVYKQYKCMMIDESVGGCRLNWQSEEYTKTVVGLLIGMQNPEDKRDSEQWNIGVIRWMKNHATAGMEMGVEILAPHAVALATRNLTHKTRLGFFVRSLLLPELRAINQPQTLLTPPGYQIGDKLEIHLGDSRFRVRLTKLLEQTGTFCQFQFMTLKPSKMKPETGKLDRIKNFDSIWSSI